MYNFYPTQIKKTKESTLHIIWSDKKEDNIPLTKLRDDCPCANCKGESVILNNYIPIKSPFKASGYYDIERIESIGNYAIQIYWKDGHNEGIYSWDILRAICN